jgi:hypothetical protein
MEILFKKFTFKFKKYDTHSSINEMFNILYNNYLIELTRGRNYLVICKVEIR